jgi:hypothetical protein
MASSGEVSIAEGDVTVSGHRSGVSRRLRVQLVTVRGAIAGRGDPEAREAACGDRVARRGWRGVADRTAPRGGRQATARSR